LVSLGRELYRRSLRRNFPIDRLAAQDRKGDARHVWMSPADQGLFSALR
jgi:hypothetical protein